MRLDLWLLIGAALVLSAILAVRLSHRLGLPSLLAYLGLGLLIGESGFGINFDNAELAQTLGWAALVIILVEGGLTTSWRNVKPAVPVSLALATVGIVISIVVVAAAGHWLLSLDWRLALLLGAVLAPTDAAAVFSVLRRLPIPHRLAGILEAESGFNDAPVVIIVVLLSATDGHDTEPWLLVPLVVYELAAGAAVGLLLAWLGVFALRRAALPASGLYPIAVLSLAVGSYGAATLIHSSGFMACYLCALVLGNARLPHRPATRGFAEGIAWLAQIGLFVMLGLLASPSELPAQIVPALVVGSVLVLVARPLSVWISTLGFGIGRAEKVFLSWAGLRGAVPVVFATVPMSEQVPGSDRLFALVFVIVVVFTLLQGPTLPGLARGLGVTVEGEAKELDVEAAPLEELQADLLEIRIPEDSALSGVEIFELRLPAKASITLIVRDEGSFVPGPTTELRGGDRLLVVTAAEVREITERRLRAVSRRGKLAGWFGETGD
ncbi:potassium/proton antiporter [Thermomonospora umbrina]|uniref:Cell volume regulation protein A n=1 Tax=Thermomonospora umbrina TaxID=111806 RepID=A0A3D9SJW1_9ACTN|nr:potassium/proton antiporter [Thermomonospora umbrina]REE96228.1 cell volume regulation protein A [Thermomonospora umbrina]